MASIAPRRAFNDNYSSLVKDNRHCSPGVLDAGQRRKFLADFDRRSGQGRRDYAIALFLIDLGLRAVEVSRLRVDDIDWGFQTLVVSPSKASPGRQLLLPTLL